MEILPDDTKNTLKLSWLSFLEALYSLSPFQRLLAIGGIVIMIPGYWGVRLFTEFAFASSYENRIVVAKPSFQDPLPLVGGEVRILPVAGGFMGYVEVTNPNFELSATKVNYSANFYDSTGRKALNKVGQTWVAKSGKTMVVIPRFSSNATIARGEIEFSAVKWQKRLETPVVELTATEPIVFESGSGIRLEGQVINKSPYTLGAARVVIFAYDKQNKPIGVAERYEFTLKPNERRAYVLAFPDISILSTFRVVATADTNTSDVANIAISAGQLQLDQGQKPK